MSKLEYKYSSLLFIYAQDQRDSLLGLHATLHVELFIAAEQSRL